MVGKLILHIGPPKTGTTSLQYALKSVNHPDFFYAGVFQHRGSVPFFDLAKQLYKYSIQPSNYDAKTIKNSITKLVNKFDIVFLSEEMFLVPTESISLEERFSNVLNLLDFVDLTVLYTFRKPEAAVPSFFQELYAKLPNSYVVDFNTFSSSVYGKIYNPEFVQNIIEKYAVKFKMIDIFSYYAKNNKSLSELVGDSNFEAVLLDIPYENRGNKKGANRILIRDNFISRKINYVSRRLQQSRLGKYSSVQKICHSLDKTRKMLMTKALLEENSLVIYRKISLW